MTRRWGSAPVMLMERAATPYFGVRAYGVHMNGFVRHGGHISMWVGRRAFDKPTYPGMLDNMVAGGQPAALSLKENLVKESGEEADIPEALAARALPTGAVTYTMETPEGLKPDVQFVYELELPHDFTPRNRDGEIQEFMLWPIARVIEVVRETADVQVQLQPRHHPLPRPARPHSTRRGGLSRDRQGAAPIGGKVPRPESGASFETLAALAPQRLAGNGRGIFNAMPGRDRHSCESRNPSSASSRASDMDPGFRRGDE